MVGSGNTGYCLEPQIVTPAVSNYGEALAAVALGTGPGGAEASLYVYLAGGQDYVYGAASLQGASANLNTSLTTGQQSSMEIMWTEC